MFRRYVTVRLRQEISREICIKILTYVSKDSKLEYVLI